MMDATSRYFLFGLLTLFDVLNVMFSWTLGLGQGLLEAETFGMVYCYHHSQWDYWAHLIFPWFPFLIPTLPHYINLEHYWLLECYYLLIFHPLFAPDLYSLHYFELFDPGHYFTPFCLLLFLTPLFTLWLGLLIPHSFIYTCIGNTLPNSTIYTWIRNTSQHWFW